MPNRGGFSWRRALGVTRTKQRISRKTGIPLTKSGRQRKLGGMLTRCCGCSTVGLIIIGMLLVITVIRFI